MEIIICNKLGCSNEASHGIALSLKVHPAHEAAVSSPMLNVCEEHKEGLKWDDLVTEDTWKQICKSFREMGRKEPNKMFCKLILVEPKLLRKVS